LKTAYLTDEFSTLGGMGSVAYRDPEFFREVQNQIYFQSPTAFTDRQRPSDTFEAFLGNRKTTSDVVIKTLEKEYALNGQFTDYVDIKIGPQWKQKVEREFYPTLERRLNSNSVYQTTFPDYLTSTLNTVFPGAEVNEDLAKKIAIELDKIPTASVSASFASVIATNNPQTKLSVPPPNSKIALENSIDLGLDYRGVPFTTGYSTLDDYWGNIPYPGMTSPSVIPATLRESIAGGLQGYLSRNPLESIYNPIGAASIANVGLSSSEAINFSDPFGSGFILGQIPFPKQGDTDIYSISLIGETLNGFTKFDPKTMSNGDGIDPRFIPAFEQQNPDPDGGGPPLSRTFNLAY